jgi:hypothetical protein
LQQANATRRGDRAVRSKVSIYRSHGEHFRELPGTRAQCAKGDGSEQFASTAKIANADTRIARNSRAVYRNSPQYPVESRRIRKTASANRGPLPFDSRFGIAPRLPKNKTVRRPQGRSHRHSAHER